MAVTIWSPLPLGAPDGVRVGEAQLELTGERLESTSPCFSPLPWTCLLISHGLVFSSCDPSSV